MRPQLLAAILGLRPHTTGTERWCEQGHLLSFPLHMAHLANIVCADTRRPPQRAACQNTHARSLLQACTSEIA